MLLGSCGIQFCIEIEKVRGGQSRVREGSEQSQRGVRAESEGVRGGPGRRQRESEGVRGGPGRRQRGVRAPSEGRQRAVRAGSERSQRASDPLGPSGVLTPLFNFHIKLSAARALMTDVLGLLTRVREQAIPSNPQQPSVSNQPTQDVQEQSQVNLSGSGF